MDTVNVFHIKTNNILLTAAIVILMMAYGCEQDRQIDDFRIVGELKDGTNRSCRAKIELTDSVITLTKNRLSSSDFDCWSMRLNETEFNSLKDAINNPHIESIGKASELMVPAMDSISPRMSHTEVLSLLQCIVNIFPEAFGFERSLHCPDIRWDEITISFSPEPWITIAGDSIVYNNPSHRYRTQRAVYTLHHDERDSISSILSHIDRRIYHYGDVDINIEGGRQIALITDGDTLLNYFPMFYPSEETDSYNKLIDYVCVLGHFKEHQFSGIPISGFNQRSRDSTQCP